MKDKNNDKPNFFFNVANKCRESKNQQIQIIVYASDATVTILIWFLISENIWNTFFNVAITGIDPFANPKTTADLKYFLNFVPYKC